MNKSEKARILLFAREGFTQFYNNNYIFLSNELYKPGKRTYRNLFSLNKMMAQYLATTEDYIRKVDVINNTGWGGSSSYVQHERIITNFGLSDTSWKDTSRPVLLLSEKGLNLRNKYKKYIEENPEIDLMSLKELPTFAINYLIKELKETDSQNMTLWKNTIITTLYLYCELGYLPVYRNADDIPTERERRALVSCCNYTIEDELMDLTYIIQPIAMLRNLKLIDSERRLTNRAYSLLKDMKMFKEVETSMSDYEEVLLDDLDGVEQILNTEVALEEVEAPERQPLLENEQESHQSSRNINFDKKRKEQKLTGNLGEKLVLDYERKRLSELGENDIEDKVFLTSSKKEIYGNAFPCDIISYDPETGNHVYIEVKTTKGNIDTPFYISRAEVEFASQNCENYRLYRVFNAITNRTPKFYKVQGKIEDNFMLKGETFIASRNINNEVD